MKIKTNQERVQGIGIPLMLESIEVKSLEMEDDRMVCPRGKYRHFCCNAKNVLLEKTPCFPQNCTLKVAGLMGKRGLCRPLKTCGTL